ncbi:MAG: 3-methyl-2-oxobutanoate hydroxymethyltransferase [Candidatus Omnitrophota bacterium]
MERKKITIPGIQIKKEQKKKITMLTAYDYPTALLIDRAGIDMILVGDSVGMVVLGYDSTVPVTMDEMMHHAKAVRRAVNYALVVGDMPFMSYHVSKEEAIANAGRFMKEAGCDAVKLEWVNNVAEITKAIVDSGIPVMGHIGLTPQTASQLGGFKVQGKDATAAKKLLNAAEALEKAGCFSIVLECIPEQISDIITDALKIPTIGIGAGAGCDGQVLVTYDMLGLFERFTPKFVKQYANLSPGIYKAVVAYKEEVEALQFPSKEHTFFIKDEELKKLKKKA